MKEQNNNELWTLRHGVIAAYTEDSRIMRNIQRTKRSQRWKIMAEYFKGGKRIAVQYMIPRADRKQAEKVFDAEVSN